MAESSTPHTRLPDLGSLSGVAPVRRLPGRNATKADLLVFRVEGADVAVKDYSARSFVVRNTIGRLLIRRESAAYRAASGIAGLPPFLGRAGPFSLALRWVAGTPLAGSEPPRVDGAVFDRARAILRDLHSRGIAHGDLHHRDLLLCEDGSVFIVDLATALVLGSRPGPIRRFLFRRLRDADLVALARMRARFTGGDVDAAAASVGSAAAAWHARGRALRRLWRRP